MATPFSCPACGGTIAAEVSPGARVVCPLCRREIIVPNGALMADASSSPGSTLPSAQTPAIPYYGSTASGGGGAQGMAIAALVCGIVGLIGCAPVGLLGVILGIIAVRRTSREPQQYGGRGLAIGGIVTGALAMLFVPVVISIMLPGLSRARELSKRTVCCAQLRSMGITLHQYATLEPNGAYPEPGAPWIMRLQTFDPGLTPKMFTCPSDLAPPPDGSYYYVPGYTLQSDMDQILLYERPDIHGGEGGNIMRNDGSVRFVPSPQYEQLIDNLTLPDGTPWVPHKKHLPPPAPTP